MWYCNVALFLNIKSFNINQCLVLKALLFHFFVTKVHLTNFS